MIRVKGGRRWMIVKILFAYLYKQQSSIKGGTHTRVRSLLCIKNKNNFEGRFRKMKCCDFRSLPVIVFSFSLFLFKKGKCLFDKKKYNGKMFYCNFAVLSHRFLFEIFNLPAFVVIVKKNIELLGILKEEKIDEIYLRFRILKFIYFVLFYLLIASFHWFIHCAVTLCVNSNC
jgi:hypothetical protein